MTAGPTENPSNITPFFRYRDAAAAIDWLERAFGFRRILVVPDESGGVAHAQLDTGGGVIMLSSPREGDDLGMRHPRDLGAVTQGVFVRVDDVDAHFERANKAGADVLMPPVDQEYGARDYSVRDLEGFLWSFGDFRTGGAEQ